MTRSRLVLQRDRGDDDSVAASPEVIQLDESEDTLIIGRSKQADVVIDIPSRAKMAGCLMSRRHAQLRRIRGGWALRDLKSTNGVALNDACLGDTERALVDGDVILFGGGPDRDPDLGVTYIYEQTAVVTERKRKRSEEDLRKTLDATTEAYEAHINEAVRAVECSACRQPLCGAVILECGHAMSSSCFLAALDDPGVPRCPMCSTEIRSPPTRAPCLDAAVDALIRACDDAAQVAYAARLADLSVVRLRKVVAPERRLLAAPVLDDVEQSDDNLLDVFKALDDLPVVGDDLPPAPDDDDDDDKLSIDL